MRVAWGCRTHTGWAVAVLVGGDAQRPVVLERRRLILCPDDLPRQVYHAAQGLPPARAAALVGRVGEVVERATAEVVAELVSTARDHGELVGVALLGTPRDLPDLPTALSNHSMLHSAEGELYRGALDDAARDAGIRVTTVPAKRTVEEAAIALGTPVGSLRGQLVALRSELGPPWQADHRDATSAALMVLGPPP